MNIHNFIKKNIFKLAVFTSVSLYGFYSLAQQASIDVLDKYIENAYQQWNVPGIAVAIIKNDKILLNKGYGIRRVGEADKVNESTVFPIASITKSFTAAAIARLVDQKKLNWEDKVVDYLPYFKLYDPYVTANFTIIDLLSHRSGLATFSGDLIWYLTSYNRKEVIERAKYLKPVYGFRTHYGYSNICYIAASELIEAITDTTWEDYIRYNFLKPLQMKNSSVSVEELEKTPNKIAPHTEVEGKQIPLFYQNWNNMGGAGAINSSVNDLLQWMSVLINKGTYKNKQYFSEEACRMMWSPQIWKEITAKQEERFPTMHFSAYGLGWGLNDYYGKKVIGHSGGYDGVVSYLCIVPEEKLGFVILTNSNSSLYYALQYKILDFFLSKETRDWSNEMLTLTNKYKAYTAKEEKKFIESRVLNTKPSLDLQKYAGTYTCPMYGDAKVTIVNEQLQLQFIPAPLFKANLQHWHYDTFTVKFDNFPSLPMGTVNFTINTKPEVISMNIYIENPDFDFTELKFTKASDK